MKILVTGAQGQLGHDVVLRLNQLGHEPFATDRSTLDITDSQQVEAFFEAEKPDAVIHCAAYTAVDKAEAERKLCTLINITGSENIAVAAEKHGAKMLYVSTDYVFGGAGTEPYEVNSEKAPVNHYGATKLKGENAVIKNCKRHFIVRTSWVFGVNGKNFVKTMLFIGSKKNEISVVNDQVGSPTFTRDLAKLICDMIVTEKYGVYHATNEGFCSWYDFAKKIMELSGTECEVKPISTGEYPCAALRPANSRLSKASLDEAGFERLPDWQTALEQYLAEYTDN